MAILLSNVTLAQNSINFIKQGYYPEGIAYYEAEKVFLVSSMTQGEIGAVNKNGSLSIFITDTAIISPIGIKINKEKGLLYVANSDIGVSTKTKEEGQEKIAQVLVYNLKTKKRVAIYDLSKISGEGNFFANDLTYDPLGNIYVTNSFGPHIWKIDTKGKTSIFATSELFKVPINHFGLNGIVYHPDGYLIVAHYAHGLLYKIPVANPANTTQIELSFTPIGADGLELIDKNTLLMVVNKSGAVKLNAAYTLQTTNNWKTAKTVKISALNDGFPTTTTKKGNKVFTLYSHLDQMLSGTKPGTKNFSIERIKYD